MAGAEPSAGFNFNIALHGDHEEEVSGTELAAEWAFSSLQKFGQEFLKKIKGKKMPNKLLEKVSLLGRFKGLSRPQGGRGTVVFNLVKMRNNFRRA